MFDIVLLNIIFVLIPIVCYMLYSVYENVFGSKYNDLFFGFAIVTSIYLITKYSLNFNYLTSIIKVLFLICLLKNKNILSALICIYLSIYYGIINNYSILMFFVEYFIEIIVLLFVIKNVKYEHKIIVFYIIDSIFGILYTNEFIQIFYSNILYAVLSYILIVIMNKTDEIINIYGTVRQIEYEKNFRDSLFKVTHEIKNPIAVCKGYLDMLDVNNNKQVNKYIPIIKEEIDRTLLLMKDFLNLTRLKVDKSIMDISLLLDDLINSTNTLLTELNIKFKYQILDDEMYINGDYNRLKQVFINLIKNSIEAIPKNREGIIKLCINLKKDNILISIEDNGIGISKNKINKIGEPFFTTKEKGTGLGVRLSTEIIEQHNGSIKYVSKEGKGTKVIITLPICE